MAQQRRRTALKKRTVRLLLPFVLVFCAAYSLYQLFNGERGFFTWLDLRQQVFTLRQQNLALLEQKQLLEDKTERLNPRQIDEDYLDELIRRNLPYVKANEYIIFLPETLPEPLVVTPSSQKEPQ